MLFTESENILSGLDNDMLHAKLSCFFSRENTQLSLSALLFQNFKTDYMRPRLLQTTLSTLQIHVAAAGNRLFLDM